MSSDLKKRPNNTNTGTVFQGVCGKRMPIGMAKIQFPFTKLRISSDLEFLIFSKDVPALLSMKDMIVKTEDIIIQHRQITLAGLKRALVM